MPDVLSAIISHTPDPDALWEGRYKIPWDDPEFSRRMLAEHLSQDHDLASRRYAMITDQVRWLHRHLCNETACRLLDLGCGPGLYLDRLAALGYTCWGVDFSPAAVDYARDLLGDRGTVTLDDLRTADLGSGYDCAVMLYGELNVFSPDDCRAILGKTLEALNADGRVAFEVHEYEVVRRSGRAPNSWYRSGEGLSGLFSGRPHLCLIENHWYEAVETAQQTFYVVDGATGAVDKYVSTTRAWSDSDLSELLAGAGFVDIRFHLDWPVPPDTHQLVTARKPK